MFPVKFNDADYKDTIQKSSKMVARSARSGRNLLLDFLVYNAVLAVCTFVGMLFRSLGFSDATIISVYILGVLVSAVLITIPTLLFLRFAGRVMRKSDGQTAAAARKGGKLLLPGGKARKAGFAAEHFLYDRSEAQGDRQEI